MERRRRARAPLASAIRSTSSSQRSRSSAVARNEAASWRLRTESQVERVVETVLPNRHGRWRAVGYRGRISGVEHLALVYGDIGDGEKVQEAFSTFTAGIAR